jgi:N6-L-threonylcarbamoyladenine synthase
MTLLALETSCDETSVAIVRDGRVLSSLVSSQIKLHAEYGGNWRRGNICGTWRR